MIDLKNAEDRTAFRRRQIQELEELYKIEESKHKDKVAGLEAKLRAVAAEHVERSNEIATLKETADQHRKVLKDVDLKVKEIQEQIRDRRAYLNEQEDIIAKALDEGNQQLVAKRREIEEAKLEQEEYLRQKLMAERDSYLANQEREVTSKKLKDLQEAYDQKAGELREALSKLRGEVERAGAEYRETLKGTEVLLTELSVKEKELAGKADVLEKASIDLSRRQRKLESDEAIYHSR